MRILHYSLGLPPYRSGGMTKYCTDLMVEQAKSNNEVLLLFPGRMNFIKEGNTNIKFYREYKKVKVYELINPLPVPILNGISNPKLFTRTCDKKILKKFLKNMNIDIVHIHTFMGLYKEFLEVCKELDIKIVFTSHDYFGLCTKVNFIDYNGEICEGIDLEKCTKCNLTGDSIKKIKILQSKYYRYIKDKGIIDKFKKYIKPKSKSIEKNIKCKEIIDKKEEYITINKYYYSMFEHIDKILFNSELAEYVYNKHIETDGIVIPITHSVIKDNRKLKNYEHDVLKLTYLGPYKEYKGFNLLLDVMTELENEGYEKITLSTYGDAITNLEIPINMNINNRYSYLDLNKIFEDTDSLIVPSIWNETFGFITLEALSYGVPVLLTNKVGSKDLVKKFDESMIVDSSVDELKEKIIKIFENKNILKQFNKNVLVDKFIYTIDNHHFEIIGVYNSVLDMK